MRRREKKSVVAKLEMTPMIDVVFQLLIFFIFSIVPVDTFSELEVFRPQGSDAPVEIEALAIRVMPDGVYLNDRKCNRSELRKRLAIITRTDKKQHVNVICDRTSKHGQLIEVLDTCEALRLEKINIASI